MNNASPYVKELPRRAGQKETRFIHLLGETTTFEEEDTHEEPVRKNTSDLDTRLAAVEQELALVKETLAKITKDLF